MLSTNPQSVIQLFTDCWKTTKGGPVVHASHISEDDLVVFVVGASGSGKSWFAKEVTASEAVKSSQNLHPDTKTVQAIRCRLKDEATSAAKGGTSTNIKSIVFVDTPSFSTGSLDFDPKKEMETWISQAKLKLQNAGVIYMHRVESDPKYLRVEGQLQELILNVPEIGIVCRQRLLVVVSHDETTSTIDEATVKRRISELSAQVGLLKGYSGERKPSVFEARFRGNPAVAWEAVEKLFES